MIFDHHAEELIIWHICELWQIFVDYIELYERVLNTNLIIAPNTHPKKSKQS